VARWDRTRADVLVASAYSPYRYAAGLCDHVGPTLEHPSAAIGWRW
jgi:hypothetical protein